MDDAEWRQRTITACGVIALAGCALVGLGDIVGTVVAGHDPIGDTISKLAIGEHAWIQDLGLDAFALGVFALAVGLFVHRDGDWRWLTGLALLTLLSLDIVLIAEHNQYAGRPGRGAAVHMQLVVALYLLFAAAPMFLAEGLGEFGERWRFAGWTVAGLWLVLAPVFFVVPDGFDGGYERLLGLIMLVAVGGVGWKLYQLGREA